MDKQTLENITIEAKNISEILAKIWLMRRVIIMDQKDLPEFTEERIKGILFYLSELEKQL